VVLALIPARSGSKTIPHKNVRLFRGRPLLAHSIAHALAATSVDRVIVSTDSAEYAVLARESGAETPFLRPKSLAEDDTLDIDVFVHALDWLKQHEDYRPAICVHLRPTCPVRRPEDIDSMVALLRQHDEVHSVRSIVLAPHTPYKMWLRESNGLLRPVATCDVRDAYNAPRQALPPVYLQNASIDVVRTSVIENMRSMSGSVIHGYVMDNLCDIDTERDFEDAVRRA
jgi:CMP-N,N'-diacetyllegionaminic acid synthase